MGTSFDAMDTPVPNLLVIPTLIATWGITRGRCRTDWTRSRCSRRRSADGLPGSISTESGRVRTLQITILWFAISSTASLRWPRFFFFTQLLGARESDGFGLQAVNCSAGSVLIGEVIPATRPPGGGREWFDVAGRSAGDLPSVSYRDRVFFRTGGVCVACAVCRTRHCTSAVYQSGFADYRLDEPDVQDVRGKSSDAAGADSAFTVRYLSGRHRLDYLPASMLATGVQGGYYAVTTWPPTYLKTERRLSVIGTGSYLGVVIVGSYCGS